MRFPQILSTLRACRIPQQGISPSGYSVALLCLGSLLLFPNLGNIFLWQDEAETAILAERILRYGFPKAFDGKNLVLQAPHSFNTDLIWTYHPWLQFYLVSPLLSVFPKSTTAARLPFALIGLLTILYCYRFALCHLENQRAAFFATLLLISSVPFLLHMRQCRYYALAAFFTLGTLDAYLRLQRREKQALLFFVLMAHLLFQTNFGFFFPTLFAIYLHALLISGQQSFRKHLFWAGLILAVTLLPWVWYLDIWRQKASLGFWDILDRGRLYLHFINDWVFPWILLLPLVVLLWKRRLSHSPLLLLLGLVILIHIVSLAFFSQVLAFRYIVPLIPLFAIVLGLLNERLLQASRLLGGIVFGFLLTTNVFSQIPYQLWHLSPLTFSSLVSSLEAVPQQIPLNQALISFLRHVDRFFAEQYHASFRIPLLPYLYELTHDYDGPNEGVIRYLQQHAKPADRVWINYEDLPLIFYTDLVIEGGLANFRGERPLPQWIVVRKSFLQHQEVGETKQQEGEYVPVVLPYPDIPWENRPDPYYHKYGTVTGVPSMVIYRLQKDAKASLLQHLP